MIVASAALVNARLIFVDGVESDLPVSKCQRRHGKLANYALIRAAGV